MRNEPQLNGTERFTPPECDKNAPRPVLVLMPLEHGNVATIMISIEGATNTTYQEIFDMDLVEPCWVRDGFRCPLGETTIDGFGRPLCHAPASSVRAILEKEGEATHAACCYLGEVSDDPVVLYWVNTFPDPVRTTQHKADDRDCPQCPTGQAKTK